jgi:hypothetical protein
MAGYVVRSLLSEGHVKYVTVINQVAVELDLEGPTALLMTTTEPFLEPQMETRLLSLESPADSATTRAALKVSAASRNKRPEADLTGWQAVQTWLGLAGARHVHMEYADHLAERVPAEPVAVRRAFEHLLTTIESVAVLHQRQRSINGDRIVATVGDYAMARVLIADAFKAVLVEGITPAVRRAVEAVVELYGEQGKPISVSDLARHLSIAKQTASRNVQVALERKLLINDETREGRAYQLRPGEPMPDEVEPLPTPDELANLFPYLQSGWVDPLTGETHEPPPENDADGVTVLRESYVEEGGDTPADGTETGGVTEPSPNRHPPAFVREPNTTVTPSPPESGGAKHVSRNGHLARFALEELGAKVVSRCQVPNCGGELWQHQDGRWLCRRCHPPAPPVPAS